MNNFYSYKAQIEKNRPEVLVIFCSSIEFELEDFISEIIKQFEDVLFSKELFLIAPAFLRTSIHSELIDKPTEIIRLKNAISLNIRLDLHFGFIDISGKLHYTFLPHEFHTVRNKLNDKIFRKVLEIGLNNIAKKRDLVIEANSFMHFVKPSGKHSNKFIKVANILESAPEISFIATNLFLIIRNRIERIYVDTPGILVIAHELSRQISIFNNQPSDVKIDSFLSYEGIKHYSFSSKPGSLIIISASTSNNLSNIIDPPTSMKPEIVSIASAKSTPDLQALINFDKFINYDPTYYKPIDSYKESSCPLCLNEKSIPIQLDKKNFTFEAPRTTKYLPLASDADENLRKLIANYKETNAFRCRFDGLEGKKQPTPEYFIDVSKLLSSENYLKKVDAFFKRHFPLNCNTIIHCNDSGARELALTIRGIASKYGKEIPVFDNTDNVNEGAEGIVIIGGSMQSGKALLNISRELRLYRNTPLTYIVGFAKYQSTSSFDKLKRDLTFHDGPCGKHNFHTIEEIILPINEHRLDSWQKEIETLNTLKPLYTDKKISEQLGEREFYLRSATSIKNKGIGAEIFLSSPKNEKLILGASFAFWDKKDNDSSFDHQATVYYTISSVLQKLRTQKNNRNFIPLEKGYIIRQLDPLLFDRFNEGIIQASFLRASKSRELDYSGDDESSKIIGSLLERMLRDPYKKDSEALPEFLLAICTRKLQIKKDHLLELEKHNVKKAQSPLIWVLAEHARKIIFEDFEADTNFF